MAGGGFAGMRGGIAERESEARKAASNLTLKNGRCLSKSRESITILPTPHPQDRVREVGIY